MISLRYEDLSVKFSFETMRARSPSQGDELQWKLRGDTYASCEGNEMLP